jgi:putative membrane protein
VPGISYDNATSLLAVALILGVVNALVRPILRLLTCPLILLTLGLFTFVLNALLLLLTAALGRSLGFGFYVDGFGPAFFGALVISAVSLVLSIVFKEKEEKKE